VRRRKFSSWWNHPVSFLFWFFVGLCVLRFGSANSQTEVIQMSSVDEKVEEQQVDLSETNFNEIQSLSDDDLLRQLEENSTEMNNQTAEIEAAADVDEAVVQSYALNYEQLEEINDDIYNPEAKPKVEYETISDDTFRIQYEDPKDAKVCPAGRLYYEKLLTSPANSKALKALMSSATPENPVFSKKCILHVMNRAGLGRSNLAICSKAVGGVTRGGAKPCVTENLVNTTYNAYVDVMDCLNINPKFLFPKISQESGFLINAFGAGRDGGIGQFTQAAIEETNKVYDDYLKQMEIAAYSKASCARIMQYKSLLKKANHSSAQRCSMIGVPENPLRNIVYVGVFNRMQMDRFSGIKYNAGQDLIDRNGQYTPVTNTEKDEFEGIAKANKYKESLEELGIKNPNMHFFKEMLTLAGYNMGSPTAIRLFSKYLELRKAAKKPLTDDDFDFNRERLKDDVDGDQKKRSAIDIAKSYIMSSFIGKKDSAAVRRIKLNKRKQLPKVWATAYLKSFPEFLTLRANSYDGKQITRYQIYGAPGYVSYIAEKNRNMRELSTNSGIDPNFCSDPNFLSLRSKSH
jgi:hypothetical protein